MPSSNAVPGFLPSTNGFHFANHFPPGPTLKLGVLDPRWVGIGDAAAGLCGGMALTASLEILKDMAGGAGPRQAWLALGHSGWAPGQLDREMQDNAWLVVDGDAGLVFDGDFATKWQRALDRLGGGDGGVTRRFDPASFSHQTGRA